MLDEGQFLMLVGIAAAARGCVYCYGMSIISSAEDAVYLRVGCPDSEAAAKDEIVVLCSARTLTIRNIASSGAHVCTGQAQPLPEKLIREPVLEQPNFTKERLSTLASRTERR